MKHIEKEMRHPNSEIPGGNENTMHPNTKLCQKVRSLPVFTALTLFAALAVQAHAQRIIKFDAPNSGTGAYEGTAPAGINLWGTITGSVTDNNNGTHGFVGTPGQFTDFDVPGANPVVGCTCPDSINDLGVVAGYDIDTNNVGHGFLRTPHGKITTFDVLEAGTGAYQGTYPVSITLFEVIAGNYIDTNNVSHGFVRTPDGKITTFDVLEAGTGAYQGTTPGGINDLAVVAGYYTDGNYVNHGFVRKPDGKITTFDAPGAVGSAFGTIPYGINDLAVVAGYYLDTNYTSHGFLRTPDGVFTAFEAPGAGTGLYQGIYAEGTFPTVVNLEGATTGFIVDDNAETHPFVSAANGKATTFDIPGQLAVPGTDIGAAGEAINAQGVIAGRWHDVNYVLHGFVRTP